MIPADPNSNTEERLELEISSENDMGDVRNILDLFQIAPDNKQFGKGASIFRYCFLI